MTRIHFITHKFNTSKLGRHAGLFFALAGLVAALVAPAQGLAAPVKFGSKLNPAVQPSNSVPGISCGPE